MESFIKKIFENKIDDKVHQQFQKFSRGTFKDRALLKITKSSNGFSLSTSSEYANELVHAVAEKLGNEKTKVTGVIVSTQSLAGKLNYTDIKQFMGIKQYVIDSSMSGIEITKLIDSLPDAFFALSFSFSNTLLKIKPKAPKSAKPKTSEAPAKPNFCSLKTQDINLINNFIIETGNWKKIEANHTFVINDIELPQNTTDPSELRKQAKRKGKLIRKSVIDGKEVINEKDFIA